MRAKVLSESNYTLVKNQVYEVRNSTGYAATCYDVLVDGIWDCGWLKTRFELVSDSTDTIACECSKCKED